MVLEKQKMYADSHTDTSTSGMGIGQIYSIAMFLLKKSPAKGPTFVVERTDTTTLSSCRALNLRSPNGQTRQHFLRSEP